MRGAISVRYKEKRDNGASQLCEKWANPTTRGPQNLVDGFELFTRGWGNWKAGLHPIASGFPGAPTPASGRACAVKQFLGA